MDSKEMMADILGIRFETKEIACLKHGAVMGNIAIYPDGHVVSECPKCLEERETIELESVRKSEHDAIIRQYKESNIEAEYWDKTLDDYQPVTASQKAALDSVKKMIENHSGKVILLGSNGVGKSMLGSCAVKELGGKILSMYEISTMIRQSYTNRAEKTELEIVQDLANIPFLVIDELGRTKGSEAELNWLSYVLDKRHVRNKPFMLLSNTHLMSKCPNKGCSMCFENYINNDILSRLRQNSKLINVDGPDYRANK